MIYILCNDTGEPWPQISIDLSDWACFDKLGEAMNAGIYNNRNGVAPYSYIYELEIGQVGAVRRWKLQRGTIYEEW